MPDKTNTLELLRKLLKNDQLNDRELKELYQQFNSDTGIQQTNEEIDSIWVNEDFTPLSPQSPDKLFSSIKQQTIGSKSNPLVRKIYRWSLAAAAVLILLLAVSAPFFFNIQLKSDQIAQLQEVTADNGHIKKLKLSDGTKVWLNPGSSIIYKSDFSESSSRTIRLWGQAYFEVAHNAQKPFILEMGDIGLKVLGTSFNACNYKEDKDIRVVLKEGKVSLFQGNYADAQKFTELTPGHLAQYTKGRDGFAIEKANVDMLTSWIDGVLIFRDERMDQVFRQLERWYDVRIVVSDQEINDYLFTATIKTESLTQILKLLEFTSQLEYQVLQDNGFQAYKPTILIKPKPY